MIRDDRKEKQHLNTTIRMIWRIFAQNGEAKNSSMYGREEECLMNLRQYTTTARSIYGFMELRYQRNVCALYMAIVFISLHCSVCFLSSLQILFMATICQHVNR